MQRNYVSTRSCDFPAIVARCARCARRWPDVRATAFVRFEHVGGDWEGYRIARLSPRTAAAKRGESPKSDESAYMQMVADARGTTVARLEAHLKESVASLERFITSGATPGTVEPMYEPLPSNPAGGGRAHLSGHRRIGSPDGRPEGGFDGLRCRRCGSRPRVSRRGMLAAVQAAAARGSDTLYLDPSGLILSGV